MRAIVVGGGIGGMSATIGLRRAGIDATLCEQRQDLTKAMVGGGFHLWPNAIRALGELGLADKAGEVGMPIELTEFHSFRGRQLASWHVGDLGREVGGSNVGISRPSLQGLLYEALDKGAIQAGAELTSFDEEGGGVTARFADGREERGDVLVGADGLRSVVRAELLGAADPDYAGYVQWQTVLEGAGDLLRSGTERITFGPASRTVMHHVDAGLLFWACVLYTAESDAGTPPGRKEKLRERFARWPAPVEEAIDATPEDRIVGLPIYDRKPVKRWGRGRVTLLGDAAHPMTTNTSQGGNQAIEDGVVLARCLAGAPDVEQALRSYEERRIARTTPLVRQSRMAARMNALRASPAVRARDRIFTAMLPRVGLKETRKAVETPL